MRKKRNPLGVKSPPPLKPKPAANSGSHTLKAMLLNTNVEMVATPSGSPTNKPPGGSSCSSRSKAELVKAAAAAVPSGKKELSATPSPDRSRYSLRSTPTISSNLEQSRRSAAAMKSPRDKAKVKAASVDDSSLVLIPASVPEKKDESSNADEKFSDRSHKDEEVAKGEEKGEDNELPQQTKNSCVSKNSKSLKELAEGDEMGENPLAKLKELNDGITEGANLSESLTTLKFNQLIPMTPLDMDDTSEKVSPSDHPTQTERNLTSRGTDKLQTIVDAHLDSNDAPKDFSSQAVSLSERTVLVIEPRKSLSSSTGSPENSRQDDVAVPEDISPIGLHISNVFSMATDTLNSGITKEKQKGSEMRPIDLSVSTKTPVVIAPIKSSSFPTLKSSLGASITVAQQLKDKYWGKSHYRTTLVEKTVRAKPSTRNTSSACSSPHQMPRQKVAPKHTQTTSGLTKRKHSGGGYILILPTPTHVIPVVNKRLVFSSVRNREEVRMKAEQIHKKSKSSTAKNLHDVVSDMVRQTVLSSLPARPNINQFHEKSGADSDDGGMPYTCDYCHMSFTLECDWLKHQRRQCTQSPDDSQLLYYCNRCPESFHRHRDWVLHRKTHLIAVPRWKCDHCQMVFSSRRDLREHRLGCSLRLELEAEMMQEDEGEESVQVLVMEEAESPTKSPPTKFTCDVCKKHFPYPSALRVHQETHILKHKCPVCHQAFTRFYEMTKHVRNLHPEVSSHTCEHCGKVFDRLTILYRHKADGLCTSYMAPEGAAVTN